MNEIVLDLDRGGRCQAEYSYIGPSLLEHTQVEIVATKVLAPVRNAVDLVDDEAIDLVALSHLGNQVEQTFRLDESFRGQVNNIELFIFNLAVDLAHFALAALGLRQ